MNLIIRKMRTDEYVLLNDFLYQAIYQLKTAAYSFSHSCNFAVGSSLYFIPSTVSGFICAPPLHHNDSTSCRSFGRRCGDIYWPFFTASIRAFHTAAFSSPSASDFSAYSSAFPISGSKPQPYKYAKIR